METLLWLLLIPDSLPTQGGRGSPVVACRKLHVANLPCVVHRFDTKGLECTVFAAVVLILVAVLRSCVPHSDSSEGMAFSSVARGCVGWGGVGGVYSLFSVG